MAEVVADLELALEYQESYESGKPMEYEEILEMADREHPLVYTNKRELKLLLSSGILIDWGRRWFSLSKSEHNCEIISESEFSFQDPELIEWISDPKSRFSEVAKIERAQDLNIDVDVETMFLSLGITYAAYLVFKFYSDYSYLIEDAEVASEPTCVGLRYKLKEAGESSISYLADHTDDGWMVIELCQFVCYKKVAKLEVSLENFPSFYSILLEGIQFLPVEKQFFYLDKDGLKCCMQSARTVLKDNQCFRSISISQSRFEKVAECESGNDFHINCHINSHMLSPNTTYATYLVYRLPELSHGTFECPLEVKISDRFYSEDAKDHFIFLTSPKTMVIDLIKDDRDRDRVSQKNPLSRPKMDGVLKERKDGWMETEMTDGAAKTINREFALSLCDYSEQLTGLIVQGMEIRPK
ncbi:hypothetical protein L1987_77206 [Smallanthus sonchifolius]|uniref:Uncharacterized protein n=1 Tax=Smallanthus sonchifolius TaxID=185202 RepID=A0ACB8Z8C9_9ASTR|nr:hypothetical protein L1987_77206 [Smallanthus sonchifolius]